MSNVDVPAKAPDYLQAYSLKCDPFANALDGRFFYAGTALMQRLDLIAHLTQFGNAIVLVSGPQGSGKTTLLGRFVAQANKQWRLCLINADEFEQFPQLMADALVIGEAQDELEMLEHWASETDNSQLLVILVDKTEMLPEPAIDLLCRLLTSPVRERIRLILFGNLEAQQALKKILDSKKLPGATQLLEVPRLSEEETSSYLMYRLAVAGYSGESPFTATEVRAICKAAEGRPGSINLLAHESLLEHQARKHSKRIKTKTHQNSFGTAAWGPATLVLVALATYFGWQRLQPTPEPGSPADEPAVATQSIPLPIPELAPEPESVTPPILPATTVAEVAAPIVQAVPESTAQLEPKAVTSPITTPVSTPSETGDSTAVETTETVPTEAPASPEPESTTPEAQQPATEATAAAAKPPPAAVTVVTAKTPATLTQAAATTTPPPEASAQGPHREAWLLEQQGELYSLQLLGSRSQKSILNYMKKHKLEASESAYYRGQYRGDKWFVLMYGIYPDRQAALDARAALPAAVRKAKPWPRNLASVHKAINETR